MVLQTPGWQNLRLLMKLTNRYMVGTHIHTYTNTHTHINTYIHTYIFVVVNFDALAQASDIQIERRQVVFLCWMQNLNPGSHADTKSLADWMLADKPTELSRIKQKLELDSPSLWSASIQPTWPHCQLTLHTYIHICCCQFRCSGTGKRYSNRKETSCVPLLKAGFEPGAPDTKSPADWMLAGKPTELSRIKLKNLNSTVRPYDQRAFSPLGPTVSWLSHLALAIYIFVVVNFDALAQARDIQIERRQVVFLCSHTHTHRLQNGCVVLKTFTHTHRGCKMAVLFWRHLIYIYIYIYGSQTWSSLRLMPL